MDTAFQQLTTFPLAFDGGSRSENVTDATDLDALINSTLINTSSGPATTAQTRLLVICDTLDATVEISFLKPLRETDLGMRVDVITKTDLDLLADISLKAFDILLKRVRPTHLVFSRYTGQHLGGFRRVAHAAGLPVLCFLDDDLLNVPRELGEHIYNLFAKEPTRRTLQEGVSHSDLMLCSTPQLLKSLSPQRDTDQMTRSCKIYRSVSDTELRQIPPLHNGEAFTIGYMASSSHIGDFRAWLPDIMRFLTDHPTVRLEFFGTIVPPTELAIFGDRILRHTKASSYADFMDKLRDLQWHIGLAPLLDTPFNSNKAPTKWVEYTLAGIPTLASPVVPYAAPLEAKACHPATAQDLYQTLSILAQSNDMRRDLLEKAREELETHYRVEDHVRFLKDVLADATTAHHA